MKQEAIVIGRREFLKMTTGLSLGALLAHRFGSLGRVLAAGIHPGVLTTSKYVQPSDLLDPLEIPKYVDPLVIPPAMQPESQEADGTAVYEIGVRQFQQQVLPSSLPATTVWGYGRSADSSTFHYPAFTIEARTNQVVRVLWINQLVDDPESDEPHFLPHLLPVDPTLHWANPGGTPDSMGTMDEVPYTGPVPIVTHVHEAHTLPISDGFPVAWYLPNASDIPEGYTSQGAHYGSVEPAPPGAAWFEYPNDQRAATLWYHDHALGITRLNVYAGMAGFWILRDDVEDGLNLPGPAPRLGDEPDTKYYEIPIAIQDRTFKQDGSLWYPDNREFFDGYTGPFMPDAPVSPIWNPEFFGNTMVVNGKTWPYLEVEPRLYRFRLLNGTNSRFLILKFDQPLEFHQIASEGGLLPDAPITLDQLLMGPAERADVIVDFSQFSVGDEIILLNLGPDEPFGGLPVDPAVQAKPETTGQVMKFRVVEFTGEGNLGEIPGWLPAIERLETTLPARNLTLNEELYDPADIPIGAKLGTSALGPLGWDDPITENPMVGDVEVWNLINLTVDAHPIHLHLVVFQVVERVPISGLSYEEAVEQFVREGGTGTPPDPLMFAIGDPQPPESWETGWKDTVIAFPSQVTRIIAKFDLPGLYVWHCHILEHEDNEMMRPYHVGPIPEG